MNMKTLHQDSDGIAPYLRCPWCGYADVIGEFIPYAHPSEPCGTNATGSTECGQCHAAGPTALFVLAYDSDADMGGDERFRSLYMMMLEATGMALSDGGDK